MSEIIDIDDNIFNYEEIFPEPGRVFEKDT